MAIRNRKQITPRRGIYVVGQDNGFEFSVPADTTARTLKVYVGAYNAGMKFDASLSDSSALLTRKQDFAM